MNNKFISFDNLSNNISIDDNNIFDNIELKLLNPFCLDCSKYLNIPKLKSNKVIQIAKLNNISPLQLIFSSNHISFNNISKYNNDNIYYAYGKCFQCFIEYMRESFSNIRYELCIFCNYLYPFNHDIWIKDINLTINLLNYTEYKLNKFNTIQNNNTKELKSTIKYIYNILHLFPSIKYIEEQFYCKYGNIWACNNCHQNIKVK